jgi:hypothetical protein
VLRIHQFRHQNAHAGFRQDVVRAVAASALASCICFFCKRQPCVFVFVKRQEILWRVAVGIGHRSYTAFV